MITSLSDEKKIFFCIGSQKAGTTTLHEILAQNNKIALPFDKETHFFSQEKNYEQGMETYFKKFFNESELSACKIIGEIDPSYSYFKDTPKRIFNSFGSDVKFIMILRDPVKRAYSHYLMSKRRGYEKETFLNAINSESKRIYEDFGNIHYSYIQRGYYSKQIKKYFHYFNKENFLFVRFEEDFIKNLEVTIDKINSFLGLEHFDYTYQKKSNPATEPKFSLLRDAIYKQNKFKYVAGLFLKPQTKKKIIDNINKWNFKEINNTELKNEDLSFIFNSFFKEEVEYLEEMLDLDLTLWKYKEN
ncbi:sulfotransferase [Flavobacteriaceae bacterium XHP0103]|uniref:sulfotransferase family protein n=1 Tax=Marixanthotalea marina TaxID=2844359 RepID=UPI002989C0FC|nr:sulfotransferase [Marixanthotalea marina]MBU3820654.1 sulfotransferase [Marixanthotalea marina]